jgi:hypothetical protein
MVAKTMVFIKGLTLPALEIAKLPQWSKDAVGMLWGCCGDAEGMRWTAG